MVISRVVAIFFLSVALARPAFSAEQTYVREYVYQASEADSKITARAIALQEVRRLLLNELGTHISSIVKIQSSSDGTHLGTEEIKTLAAGVTQVVILEEKWNGDEYALKAQIKADPVKVLESLQQLLETDKKSKQISQLGSEVSALRIQNDQMISMLAQSRHETDAALTEVARLKEQLKETSDDAAKKVLQADYLKQADQLTLNELVLTAWEKYFRQKDYRAAMLLLQKAAQQGHAISQSFLGFNYFAGKTVARDLKLAAFWLGKAADQGDAMAQFILGWMFYRGEGVPHDDLVALVLIEKSAEQGFSQAQYFLGTFYFNGKVLPRDLAQAEHWLKKAANQDYPDAQRALGWLYSKVDTFRNIQESMFWYQKAAEHGNPEAQYDLGVMYGDDEQPMHDPQLAVYWWQKAANQGNANAQFMLGVWYSLKKVAAHDEHLAAIWFQKAADQGKPEAQYALSMNYSLGLGVKRDKKKAMYWLQKAADQGYPDALLELQKLTSSASH